MRMRTLGTALAVTLLIAGGAYAQQAKEPQDQSQAPGTGTTNPPGQKSQAPANTSKSGPVTGQPKEAQDQMQAPGTGTAKAPGQPPATTGTGPGPKKATPPVPGTGMDDRGSAPGTGTAQPAKK